MMLATLLTAALATAGGGDAHRAAMLEAWGDLGAARAEVEAALAKDPKDPTALLVAACVELEGGKLEAAEARTRELAAVWDGPQPKVLLALVQRRRERPAESLRDALAPAWKAAGRPDVGAKPLPGIDELWAATPEELTPEPRAAMTPGERFLFGPIGISRRAPDAVAASVHPEENSRTLNHELLGFYFRSEGPPDAEAAVAVERVGRALVSSDPANGYWELAAWSAAAPGDAPLALSDLDRLERAASRPGFEFPRALLLVELRELARRFDPEHGACRAGLAGLGLGAPLIALQMRVKATTWSGPDGARRKQRVAKVTMAIGRELAGSRTFLERLVGFTLVVHGARLTGDSRIVAKAQADAKAARDWYHHAMDASKRAGQWPFSAMCREWSPDEVEYFGRFLE